jgi:hypothetical protein
MSMPVRLYLLDIDPTTGRRMARTSPEFGFPQTSLHKARTNVTLCKGVSFVWCGESFWIRGRIT